MGAKKRGMRWSGFLLTGSASFDILDWITQAKKFGEGTGTGHGRDKSSGK